MARWLHLVGRFFDVVFAYPLDDDERRRVSELLRPGPEFEAFMAQPVADQRHGLEAAETVAAAAPDRLDLQRAALLHDVGKRHSGLGVVGRVLATVAAGLGGPWTRRQQRYRDHGALGAAELEAWGAEPIVVAYARHHHGTRPDEVAPGDWALLERADRARIPRRRRVQASSR